MFELFSTVWVWPAIVLAFFIGIKVAYWWHHRNESNQTNSVNQQYFQGLNFLLNEQPDKAIEVFIQALEVDSETVELHLALGGLFRRKGQVDRATRIHQNLIARPSLTQEQRLHAICELAHDYYNAGLLDRAENLYLELKDSASYRIPAIEGLCKIYQKEKEWQKAIEIMGLYKRSERVQYTRRVSHYWCELALQAINQDSFDEAEKYLRSAVNQDRTSARAVLLRGQVCFKQGKYQQAIDLWQSVALSNKLLMEFVVAEMITSYQKLDDIEGLRAYLIELTSVPKNSSAFKVWQKALFNAFGEDQAANQIINRVQDEGLSGPVSRYFLDLLDSKNLSTGQQQSLLKDLLDREKSSNIEYTCSGCGFDTKAMHWHCPNCGEWDSFC